MGTVSQEKFVELCMDPAANHFREELRHAMNILTAEQWRNMPWVRATAEQVAAQAAFNNIQVNREAAIAVYDAAKRYVMENGAFAGKSLRPWELAPIDLDREKVWWGFEFETGYRSQLARAEVVEHVWDNFDGVAFDAEGEGAYYSEITFSPTYADDCLDGRSNACLFMKYLNDNPSRINNTGETDVGTHFNISVPWATNYTGNQTIAAVLNNTLHSIPDGRANYFGRSVLYAGCFNHERYVECKLFRTTYSYERFQKYLKVCNALSLIAVACESIPAIDALYSYCSNFKELVAGSTDVPVFEYNSSMHGDGDTYYVSGDEYEDDDGWGDSYDRDYNDDTEDEDY